MLAYPVSALEMYSLLPKQPWALGALCHPKSMPALSSLLASLRPIRFPNADSSCRLE